MSITPIHPFPARMAPDIAQESLGTVGVGGRVLDPMCGSGTVLRASVEAGLDCTGVDIDPLAILMSRVWAAPPETSDLLHAAEKTVHRAKTLHEASIEEVRDPETSDFLEFWFAASQRHQLLRLATVLREHEGPEANALAISFSRIIITKEMRASLARDTSHSRPHRVAAKNDFDVYDGFLKSASQVAKRLAPELVGGKAEVFEGDARNLEGLDDDSFDIAVTSPPYLNAIDYLRGHKLTLVWLGYQLSQIRQTRSLSVGVERTLHPSGEQIDLASYVIKSPNATFADRHLGWVRRYAVDIRAIIQELHRVVKQSGKVVMVVGDSFLRGAVVKNAMLVRDLACEAGFQVEDSKVRAIPARRRYLPPPGNGHSQLDTRMRRETVLKLKLSK